MKFQYQLRIAIHQAPLNAPLDFYGNRLRVRVCGLCYRADRLLLVRHRALTGEGFFWGVPGGGMEGGETAPEALKREFLEETGLTIRVGEFRFLAEFLAPPLHAVELFFEVFADETAEAVLGHDPELSEPLLDAIAWVSFETLAALPPEAKQAVLRRVKSKADLEALRGYLTDT